MARRETPFADLLQRVRGEYLEMPGLRLTCVQARRLWALQDPTCQALLDALVGTGFLSLTADGAYVRVAAAGGSGECWRGREADGRHART
jgi:hypothetical protein